MSGENRSRASQPLPAGWMFSSIMSSNVNIGEMGVLHPEIDS